MGTNTEYDAVIFDNDGVLTTPTDYDVLVDATYDAFESVGAAEPTRDHVETLLGPDVESLRQVADDHGIDPADLWAARERAAIEAQLEELRAGRKRLYDDVSVLDRLEHPSAIVSNNQHETIANILEHLDIGGFDVWYGREPSLEGIERKKPNTYYLELAIEDLGVSNPLYVGDSRVDVTAAAEAGVDSAFVRRDHREGYDLPTEPDYEIESLAAIPELL